MFCFVVVFCFAQAYDWEKARRTSAAATIFVCVCVSVRRDLAFFCLLFCFVFVFCCCCCRRLRQEGRRSTCADERLGGGRNQWLWWRHHSDGPVRCHCNLYSSRHSLTAFPPVFRHTTASPQKRMLRYFLKSK